MFDVNLGEFNVLGWCVLSLDSRRHDRLEGKAKRRQGKDEPRERRPFVHDFKYEMQLSALKLSASCKK